MEINQANEHLPLGGRTLLSALHHPQDTTVINRMWVWKLAAVAIFLLVSIARSHEIVLEWNRVVRPAVRIQPEIWSLTRNSEGEVMLYGYKWIENDDNRNYAAAKIWLGILNENLDSLTFQRIYGDSSHYIWARQMLQNDDSYVLVGEISDSTDFYSRRMFLLYLDHQGDSIDYLEFPYFQTYDFRITNAYFLDDGSIDLFAAGDPPNALYKINAERRLVSVRAYESYAFGDDELFPAGAVIRLRDGHYLMLCHFRIWREYGNTRIWGMPGAVVNLDENGDLVWKYVHLDSVRRAPDFYRFNQFGYMNCALEHSSGMIYASGTTDRTVAPGWGISLYKYEPDGTLLWTRFFNDFYYRSNWENNFSYLVELRPDILAVFGHIHKGGEDAEEGLYIALLDTSGEFLADTFIHGEGIDDRYDRFYDVLQLDSTKFLAITGGSWQQRLLSIRFDLDPAEVSPDPQLSTFDFQLSTFPNPFNSTTTVRYLLPHPGEVVFTLTDPLGRIIQHSAFRAPHSGFITLSADGLDSGVYLLRLTTPSSSKSSKIVLMK